MREEILSGSALLLTLAFLASSAYSWNFATHAYIANRIGKTLPLSDFNEKYGCMLPDLLNTEFSLWGNATVRGYTHGVPPTNEDFMLVWDNANWGLKKSLAYGYAAHNDVWGADFIAHWLSNNPFFPGSYFTFPLGDPAEPTLQPPGIGRKLILAAVLRTPERVNLLQTAFPNDYDFLIGVAEPKFREFVIAKTQNNFQA